MTKDVEDIIRNKAYFELNAEELERVNEFAPNEEEFTNMKWFLEETNTAFNAQKVSAPTQLKKDVMAHLTESKKKKGFWLNSVSVFLLPQGKPVYQKPGFQLAIAAVAVIGFLVVFNRYDDMADDSLAVTQKLEEPKADRIDANANEIDAIEELAEDEMMDAEEAPKQVIAQEQLIDESANIGRLENSNEIRDEAQGNKFIATQLDKKSSEIVDAGDKELLSASEVEVLSDDLVMEDVSDEEVVATRLDTKDFDLTVSEGATVLSPDGANRSVETNFTTTASAPVIMEEHSFVDVSADQIEFKAEKVIIPKRLHIDETKELNQLFFIER